VAGLTVAMVQSAYIPWKGYFDMIAGADLFVFYDDVAFTRESWRNRNRIKTKDGVQWLTVPCGPPRGRRICDVELADPRWQRRHWSAIAHAYARAAHFEAHRPWFEDAYLARRWTSLSELNQTLVRRIARELLGIRTRLADVRELDPPPDLTREDRWVAVLERLGADRFLIGPTARTYLTRDKEREIAERGIELVWMDYSGYPEYRQLFPPFEHAVSIVDLIFNEGPAARGFLKNRGGVDTAGRRS